MFKNFMFNELGITKEDIREWIKESCHEEARRLVDGTYENFNLTTVIRNEMNNAGFLCNGRLSSDVRQAVAELIFKNIEFKLKEIER